MKYYVLCFFILIGSGCATTDEYYLNPDLIEDELATLYLYRTKTFFHSLNPEKPFIYLDDKMVAKLGTGMAKVIRIRAGQHKMSVRQPILFMPSFESDSFEYYFEAGKDYYIRYSMEFAGGTVVGNIVSIHGSSSFALTTKENYESRK